MATHTFPLRNPGMEALLRRWTVWLQHAAPSLVTGLLVVLLAWLLASLTWSLLPGHRKPGSAAVSALPPAAVQSVDAAQVANKHLFGVAGVQGNAGNAPDTTLALTLHGIVAGKRASDSRALILANGDEEPYAVGATLPGGAVIRSIYPDRVLLETNGRLEALRLPKTEGTGDSGFTQPGKVQRPQLELPGPKNTPPADLGELRQQIMENPQRLMDVVRAMPVMDHGRLTGYRIYPSGNPSAFNQLGLKPGDVVTAVNGIPLTDPAQSMRVLSSLKTSEQVSITLLRNGQTQTQVLQMPAAGAQPENQDQPDNQDDSDNPP